MKIELPVRFTGQNRNESQYATHALEIEQTALLLVDCFDDEPLSGVGQLLHNVIRPVLAAVREVGFDTAHRRSPWVQFDL